MAEEKTFQLKNLIDQLCKQDGYFVDFLKMDNMEAGIILLEPDEDDTQDVHTSDELYYVIEGNGFIELGRKTRKQINEGSIIFVPAGLHHKFYGNSRKLVVLYVFARKE